MLQLVLGRSGYGKTAYVQNQIVHEMNHGQKGVLLLVPEQFSFVTGNTFLSLLGQSKYIDLEITDFTRLAHEVKNLYGGISNPVLDKSGKAILMSRAINGVQDMLKLYQKNLHAYSFIQSMLQMHTELKCCNVSPDQLLRAAGQVDKTILQNKIHDISLIMQAYDAVIADSFLDSADDLNRLYETLGKVDYLKGRKVYIDGFDGFTAQELKIIQRMLTDAQSVTITLPTDSITLSDTDFSLFVNVKRTANQLIRLAKRHRIPIAAPIKLTEPKRFQNDDLLHIEQNFMRPDEKKIPCGGAVHLYKAANLYEECDYVCRTIKKLLRTEQYRCKEIAIISRDLADYRLPLENAFRSYDLPYYEDQRQPVDSQPLINLVRYLIRIVNGSFRTDDIMAYAKTLLLGLDTEEIATLENYTILWRINGKKWLDDFTAHPSGFVSEFSKKDMQLLDQINAVRKAIILPVLKFKKAVAAGGGKIICKAIYQLLMDTKADRHLFTIARQLNEQNMSSLAVEQNRIWDLLMQLLDQIVLTMGEAPVTLKEFESLFELILTFQDLGSIPQGLDNIIVGTADRTIADAPKAVFLLGANEGVFPKSFSSTGLLNDNDRHVLSDLDIELFSDTGRLTLQEKYIAYSAVTLPSQMLSVSYCSSDMKGSALLPSAIVEQLQSIFSDLGITRLSYTQDMELIEGEKAAFELLASRWQENSVFSQSLKAYFQENEKYQDAVAAVIRQTDPSGTAFTNPGVSKELFHQDMLVSASRAEAYYHCPFLYFCKFGLGAKPRKVAEMDPMQTGTVMHYVLERLLAEYGSDGLLSISDTQRKAKVNELLEQYLVEQMGVSDQASKRFRYLFLRLQKTINLVVAHMVEEFAQSAFKTKAYELKIDRDAEIKPLAVELPDGGTLAIRGSVDRVDIMEKGRKRYLRVVDYKSGTKEFALSDVLYGLNMQMLIYLFCISSTQDGPYAGLIPSGVLYMPVRRKVSSLPRDTGDEAVLANAAKELKMKGLLLSDIDVLKGMEKDLKGKYIPVKSGKEITGSLISAEQFGALARKIQSLLIEMGHNLHQGKIPMQPVKGKNYEHTCAYCDYQSVCVNKLEKQERLLCDYEHSKALSVLEEGSEPDA